MDLAPDLPLRWKDEPRIDAVAALREGEAAQVRCRRPARRRPSNRTAGQALAVATAAGGGHAGAVFSRHALGHRRERRLMVVDLLCGKQPATGSREFVPNQAFRLFPQSAAVRGLDDGQAAELPQSPAELARKRCARMFNGVHG